MTNFTDGGGIWMWQLGPKTAVLDDSKAFAEWIASNVSLGTGELPQEFAERVVVEVLREQDDWRPHLDGFARWAKHFYPEIVNWGPTE